MINKRYKREIVLMFSFVLIAITLFAILDFRKIQYTEKPITIETEELEVEIIYQISNPEDKKIITAPKRFSSNDITPVEDDIVINENFIEFDESDTVEEEEHYYVEEEKNDSIFDEFVQKMPEFPGGSDEMYNYIYSNLKLSNIENGTLYVSFIINEDGQVDQVLIKKGINTDINNCVLKVIRMMPDWIPGEQGGKQVKVRLTLPIKINYL